MKQLKFVHTLYQKERKKERNSTLKKVDKILVREISEHEKLRSSYIKCIRKKNNIVK